MKAIDKAWEINLTLPKEEQYKDKGAIIEKCCPDGDYFHLTTNNDDSICDGGAEDRCTKCWNCEIINEEELTFNKVHLHPSLDVTLNWNNKKDFINGLNKNKESLICIDEEELYTYDNIPSIIQYLQDIYDYCTELKNKVEYVDWQTARKHMDKGNRCIFEEEQHFIFDGELYWINDDEDEITSITLKMLDSKEWILL